MVSFHSGHTAVWLCYRKWTDKSEWCCWEGSRKIDKSSRQGLIIDKNSVEITWLFSFSIHVYVWITSLFYLADDRITIRHSRCIESWFHDVDNSKDNNGNKFTIALNPYTGTVLPILRSHLDLFSISERHFSRQKGISSTGIGADRNLPVWGDKYRNVKPKSKQSLKIVTISLINLFNIFDLINYRIFQHLS